MSILSSFNLPSANMERIIVHWTAGRHNATSLDKKHYHFLIEGDGNVVQGRSIKLNERPITGPYAAHTRAGNTGSIGVSACCMFNASESSRTANGSDPMTEVQWDRMAEVCAELARHYSLPVTRRTVLGHGEVQRLLGITQTGKWDPMRLPWNTSLSKTAVGNLFRERVRHYFHRATSGASTRHYTVQPGDSLWRIAFRELGSGDRWVEIRDANGQPLSEHDATSLAAGQTLILPGHQSGPAMRPYTVQPGDSLWKIAFNELGTGSRWREIRDADNMAFEEAQAEGIDPGERVMVPVN